MKLEPTAEQYAVARRVAHKLSERLPTSGVLAHADVEQMANEALIALVEDGRAPEEEPWLGSALRFRVIDAMRRDGVLERIEVEGETRIVKRETPTLDALTQSERDALIDRNPDIDVPAQRTGSAYATKVRANKAAQMLRGNLTPREQEALALAATGLSQKQGAEIMGIGEESFKNYIRGARRALRARTTAHAVANGMRRGVID